MARINRVYQKVFAGTASNNGVFGTAQLGTKVLSNDLATLMSTAAWDTGWLDAVIGASKFPALEEFQALNYINTTQLAYLFQQGIPEWDANTVYYINSLCTGVGNTKIYASLTNANTGNALTSLTNWKLVFDFNNTRIRLDANTTYYVATTGSNVTGNGLVGTPWLTLQFAYDYISKNIDAAGYTVTIQIADGTYTGGLNATLPVTGATGVNITGNTGTPANVIISTTSANAIASTNNAKLTLAGMELRTTTSGNCVNANNQGLIDFSNVRFGACAGAHILSFNNSLINATGAYAITGGANLHMSCNDNASILNGLNTITLSGTPAFATAYVQSQSLGVVSADGCTFAGTGATGKRYDIATNSVIQTSGGGANYFPGNVAGTSATGGQYT